MSQTVHSQPSSGSSVNQTIRLETILLNQKEAFRPLFHAYLAELAQYDPHPMSPEQYPYFDLYWQSPSRFPLHIMRGSDVAGFALVRKVHSPDSLMPRAGYELCEFAVDPKSRSQGIGTQAMVLVGQRFAEPGWPLYWWCFQENPASHLYDRYLVQVSGEGWKSGKEQIRLYEGDCFRYHAEPTTTPKES